MSKKIFSALITLVAVFSFFVITHNAEAATSGPNNPATEVDDSSVGTITWSNLTRVVSSNNSYATASLNDNIISHYIKATNFGFSIPSGATINGITVEVEKKAATASRIQDYRVRIVKGGTISTNDRANANFWGKSDAYTTYGSTSDLWGETWTYSDINNANFGIAFSAYKNSTAGAGVTASIDHIRITITYTVNTAPNAPTLVSPANGSYTNDNTPTLSANYSDSDTGDTGTTNYRIATSAANCTAGTVVASGTSTATSTNNENTTWTPISSIGVDTTYYWCAQNNDGVLTSSWTSMGNFILDTTNPTSSITSPANNSFSTSTTIALSGTSSDTHLSSTTISVDSGSFVATSGTAAAWTYSATALSQGSHTFQTKATDTAGNTGLSSIVTVTVDSVAPTLSLVHIQSNNATTSVAKTGDVVTLTFTSSESTSTPTITIAGASSTVTGGPTAWSATHTMLITDTEGTVPFTINFSDLAGNAGTQVSTTTDSSSVVFDRTNPDTTILTHPTDPTSLTSASFTFSSNEVGATFECDLDGAGYSSCTSPKNYTSLSDGSHTFSVKATDTAGNIDQTPATFTWNIVTNFTFTRPASTGTGTGVYGGTSPGTVSSGTSVSVTATLDASSNFTSWIATGAAASCDSTTSSPCSFTMTGDASVQAVYTLKTFTLTYIAGANGSITGTTPQTVDYNTSGTEVIAVADSGYHFTSWSDGVLTAARTDSNVVANISVTATFVVNTPVLDHFTIDTISTQTAGTAFDIVITAKDNSGSTVTGFVGTVDLTTNSGSISPTTSGSFVGGIKTENVTLTGYGAGRTITATHTGGTETGTSNTFTVNSSATKFVIINPTDNTVGNNVDVTIQAQDGSDTLVSDYTGDVTLVLSGDATFVSGTGLVHLVNGTVTKSITDNTAQTVDLSLLDTALTNLNVSSTQDVIFSPGNLHHFSFDTISSPQIAGSDIGVVITAKDIHNNTATSFTSTVDFSTTAGSITPTISNNFVSGVLTQNVIVTQSGAGKTITATKTGGAENGISNSFVVNSGVTAKFIVNNPGNMTAGTRIGYTVTRKDQNNNLVTGGSDVVYLYTTSGVTSKFYDEATDGTVITSISIPDGQSLVNFWYYDDNEGTWVITASNHTSATDGTDSIIVSIAPVAPTQFIFDVVSSATVGDTVVVSIKAVDGGNNLATSYSRTDSSLVLNSTGNSTANTGISFNINSGVGTINISDTTAETVTLSLADNNPDVPPLSLNTRDITFNPDVFDHFSMDTISSPQTAGSDIGVVITAKDIHNNTATSFTSTVDFSTTAGSITPTISNNFVSGVLTQNVIVTQSGAGKTITATKTGDTQFFTSNTFDVNPGTVASFIVEASGGGSIGTQTIAVPFDIKITAKDSFGNIATGFTGTADISSTGTLSSGSGITSSFTAGILSAHSVTLSNAGAFTITATHTGGSETGISNSFTVASAAIVATKFIIIDPSDVQVGGSTTVTVKAVDDLGNVDSTFQEDINLVTSGSATGSGLVDIINGVGTLNISDSIVETVNLSLSDITPPTTLIFTSTQNVIFSAIPPVVSGGGGGAVSVYVAPVIPTISFSGQAFPTGNLTAFAISNGAIPIKQDLVKTTDGKFSFNFSSALSDANQYGLLITDKNGRVSQAKIFTLKDGVPSLDVKGLVMSPTVDLLRTYLPKGDFLSVNGFTTPNSTVQFEIDGTVVADKVVAATDGAYNLLWNTAALGLGKHSLRVRQTTSEGFFSEFSPTQDFNLTRYLITPTDFNSDGKINVSDMSIFLSLWYNKNNLERTKIDLNHDGKVNIQDLSIFSRTIYKK